MIIEEHPRDSWGFKYLGPCHAGVTHRFDLIDVSTNYSNSYARSIIICLVESLEWNDKYHGTFIGITGLSIIVAMNRKLYCNGMTTPMYV